MSANLSYALQEKCHSQVGLNPLRLHVQECGWPSGVPLISSTFAPPACLTLLDESKIRLKGHKTIKKLKIWRQCVLVLVFKCTRRSQKR